MLQRRQPIVVITGDSQDPTPDNADTYARVVSAIDFPRCALAGIANSFSAPGNPRRHRKAGRKMAGENEIAFTVHSAVRGRWAAGAWKFSPPVAKQFPWKRSYGHGFRRINTARVGNNARPLGVMCVFRSPGTRMERKRCSLTRRKRDTPVSLWLSRLRQRRRLTSK